MWRVQLSQSYRATKKKITFYNQKKRKSSTDFQAIQFNDFLLPTTKSQIFKSLIPEKVYIVDIFNKTCKDIVVPV